MKDRESKREREGVNRKKSDIDRWRIKHCEVGNRNRNMRNYEEEKEILRERETETDTG